MEQRCNGLYWVVLPNLPQVEEIAEDAKEEEGHVSVVVILNLILFDIGVTVRFNFYRFWI